MDPELIELGINLIFICVVASIAWVILKSLVKTAFFVVTIFIIFKIGCAIFDTSVSDIINKENIEKVKDIAKDTIDESNRILEDMLKE